jgi:uncharacterized protein (DUF1778 family)
MKTYVSPQEQRDSSISRMTTRVDKAVYDVVARAAKNGGLSISKYMEQAILKQALVDIYFEDISLLSLKSEEELAWLHTKLASKFSDNKVLMQKLEQLEGKKYNAGITTNQLAESSSHNNFQLCTFDELSPINLIAVKIFS